MAKASRPGIRGNSALANQGFRWRNRSVSGQARGGSITSTAATNLRSARKGHGDSNMRSETQRGCFKAATCVDPNGNTFFALLEANTRQEQPEGSSWTCVHFGDYASTVAFVLQDASRSDWGSRGSKCAPAGDRPADAGDLDAERRQAWRSALTTATSLPYRRVVVPASTGVDMRAVAEVLDEHGLQLRKTAWLEFDMRLHRHAKAMADCLLRHRQTRLHPWQCFSSEDMPLDGRTWPPSPFLDNVPKDQLFPELIAERLDPSQSLRDLVVEALAAAGWVANPGGSALALKQYETAVGIKEAQACLGNLTSSVDNASLDGQYWSEGRNVLESAVVLIPKNADGEQVRSLARQFADQADTAVLQSYAARLLRDAPRQPLDALSVSTRASDAH